MNIDILFDGLMHGNGSLINVENINLINQEALKLYNKESKKISYYLIDDIIYDIYRFTAICICQERK